MAHEFDSNSVQSFLKLGPQPRPNQKYAQRVSIAGNSSLLGINAIIDRIIGNTVFDKVVSTTADFLETVKFYQGNNQVLELSINLEDYTYTITGLANENNNYDEGGSGATFGLKVLAYNTALSVPSNTDTNILTYIVPANKLLFLNSIHFGGNNISSYNIIYNGDIINTTRTHFGTELSKNITFSENDRYLVFVAGDTIEVNCNHLRPYVGDFEATLIGVLLNV